MRGLDAHHVEAKVAELAGVFGTQPMFANHRVTRPIHPRRRHANADYRLPGARVLEIAGSTSSHTQMLSEKFGIGPHLQMESGRQPSGLHGSTATS
jgi:hypothetical protein